jgi:aerobic carbon-monoxide dehydrogenase medium subunit
VIPAAFDYRAPSDVAETIRALTDAGGEARVLAGGQSLLPLMKLRLARPDLLIDLRRLRDSLRYIRIDQDSIAIGALTTHAELASSALLRQEVPFVATAAAEIGDMMVRCRGTIGGSLAHVDPAGDWPAIALALGASVCAAGPAGEREISADELFVGPYTSALRATEIIVEVRLPRLTPLGAGSYSKHGRLGRGGFAVVGCCAVLFGPSCERVRVAFSGLDAAPARDRGVEEALTGGLPSLANLTSAAAIAATDVEPVSDAFGSGPYRLHLARVLALRALGDASDSLARTE